MFFFKCQEKDTLTGFYNDCILLFRWLRLAKMSLDYVWASYSSVKMKLKKQETSQSNTSTLGIMTVAMKNKSENLFPSWLTFCILLNVLLWITCLKTMFHSSTFT